MGFMNSFKKFVGYEEEDDDLDYNDSDDNDESGTAEDDYAFKRPAVSSVSSSRRLEKSPLNIPVTTRMQVIVYKVESFDDVGEIADQLKSKKAIVLNFDNTNKDTGNRVIDFLGGVAYALDGELKRISNTSFILVPYSVVISGDLLEELGGDIAP